MSFSSVNKSNSQESHIMPLVKSNHLPLYGKNIFVHSDSGTPQLIGLKKIIERLGGQVAEFFSKEIDYIVTNRSSSQLKKIKKSATDQKNLPNQTTVRSTILTSRRSQVILAASVAKSPLNAIDKQQDLLARAIQMNIKIYPLTVFEMWIRGLPAYVQEIIQDETFSKLNQVINPEKDKILNVKRLKTPCVKIFEQTCLTRPIFLEETNYMKHLFYPNSKMNPKTDVIDFSKTINKENILPLQQQSPSVITASVASSKKATEEENETTPKSIFPDASVNPNVTAVLNSTKSTQPLLESKKSTKHSKTSHKPINKKKETKKSLKNDDEEDFSGYCECCTCTFKSLNAHLASADHKQFANNKENFRSIDEALKDSASFLNFAMARIKEAKVVTENSSPKTPTQECFLKPDSLNRIPIKLSPMNNVAAEKCLTLVDSRQDFILSTPNEEKSRTLLTMHSFHDIKLSQDFLPPCSPETPVMKEFHGNCKSCGRQHIPREIPINKLLLFSAKFGPSALIEDIACNLCAKHNEEGEKAALDRFSSFNYEQYKEKSPLLETFEIAVEMEVDTPPPDLVVNHSASSEQNQIIEFEKPPILTPQQLQLSAQKLQTEAECLNAVEFPHIDPNVSPDILPALPACDPDQNAYSPDICKFKCKHLELERDPYNYCTPKRSSRSAAFIAKQGISLSLDALYSPVNFGKLYNCKRIKQRVKSPNMSLSQIVKEIRPLSTENTSPAINQTRNQWEISSGLNTSNAEKFENQWHLSKLIPFDSEEKKRAPKLVLKRSRALFGDKNDINTSTPLKTECRKRLQNDFTSESVDFQIPPAKRVKRIRR